MRRFIIVLVVSAFGHSTAGWSQGATAHVQLGDSIRVAPVGGSSAGEVTLLHSASGCLVATVAHVRGASRGTRVAVVTDSLEIEHRARSTRHVGWTLLRGRQLQADSVSCIEMRFR